MKAIYVPPFKTPAEPLEIARAYSTAFAKVMGFRPEHATTAALMAQSALETGRWKSCWNWALGNIKASEQYRGLYTAYKCNERINGVYEWFSPEGPERPKGNVIKQYSAPPWHPQTRFRAYAELEAAALEKCNFLAGSKYSSAWIAYVDGSADKAARALGAAGYYTAPIEPYARGMGSLQREFLGLLQRQPIERTEREDNQLCLDMEECMRVEIPEWLRIRVEDITALTAAESYENNRGDMTASRDAAIGEMDE